MPKRPPTMKAKKHVGRPPADPDLQSGPPKTDKKNIKDKGTGKGKGRGKGSGKSKVKGKAGRGSGTPTASTPPSTPKPKSKAAPTPSASKTTPPLTVKKTTLKKKNPDMPKSDALRKVWRETGKGCSKCRWWGQCSTCKENREKHEKAQQRGEDVD